MAKKPDAPDIVNLSVRIVNIHKKFTEPYTIKPEFTSIVAYHHAEVEKIVPAKGKGQTKTMKTTERVPLIIIWDGQHISYKICEVGEELKLNEGTDKAETFVIDRDIDETPLLPSDEFISRLLSPEGEKLIKNFDPSELFMAVKQFYEDHFYLPHPMLYNIISLYAINQSVFDAHESCPYLYIRSPEKGCGKSHLGQATIEMGNGQMSTNMKAHHVFRIVHGTKTVVGFDEIKGWGENVAKLDKETQDILALVNTGFQKGGGRVPRLEETSTGGKMKTVWYDSFCPKVFITTHAVLPSDTASRCIEVIMQKAKATEKDYGEEWYNPTRLVRLKKIREMSLLFRLKFGKEIRDISQDPQWRQKLDLSDTFVGIKNRELEIFRPLVILCLKYAPEWKDMVATYIRKNIEMRSKLDPTPVNTVLYALRSIYQDVQRMSYFPENNELSAEVCSDAVYGDVMYVSIKAIEERVKHTTDMIDLGNNPASRIGRILKDLGFTTPSIRRTFGMVRILKLSHLSDVCERYLGMVLDAEMEPGKKKLSQQERIGAIQYAFQTKKGQMTYDELLAEVGEKLTRDEVDSILKHLKEQGYVMVMGKELVWC